MDLLHSVASERPTGSGGNSTPSRRRRGYAGAARGCCDPGHRPCDAGRGRGRYLGLPAVAERAERHEDVRRRARRAEVPARRATASRTAGSPARRNGFTARSSARRRRLAAPRRRHATGAHRLEPAAGGVVAGLEPERRTAGSARRSRGPGWTRSAPGSAARTPEEGAGEDGGIAAVPAVPGPGPEQRVAGEQGAARLEEDRPRRVARRVVDAHAQRPEDDLAPPGEVLVGREPCRRRRRGRARTRRAASAARPSRRCGRGGRGCGGSSAGGRRARPPSRGRRRDRPGSTSAASSPSARR